MPLGHFSWTNRVYVLALLGLIALPVCVKIGNNDVWEHAKAGEWIVSHRQVPQENLFMFTTPHYPWIDHTWGSQVAFYLVYRIGGAPGLQLFEFACIAISFLLLLKLWRKLEAPDWLAPVSFALAISVAQFRFQPRPELFSGMGTSCLLYLVLTYIAGQRSNLWLVPLLFVPWVNVHGGVLTGVAFLILVTFVEAVRIPRRQPSIGPPDNFSAPRPRAPHLITVTLLSCAATLMNPYGLRYYLSVSPARMRMLQEHITEWSPLTAFWPEIATPFKGTMILIVLLAVVSFASGLKKRGAPVPTGGAGRGNPCGVLPLLLLVVAVVLPLQSLRHLWTSTQLLLCVMAMNLRGRRRGQELPCRSSAFGGEDVPRFSASRWAFGAGGVLTVVIALALVYQTVSTGQQAGIGTDANGAPVGLVRCIANSEFANSEFDQDHGLQGRFYNSMGNSFYLTWALFPKQQVFIDGMNAYDESILLKARQMLSAPATLENDIDRYKLNGFILLEQEMHSPLAVWLTRNPDWALVYWDGISELFVRRAAFGPEKIASLEYRCASPTAIGRPLDAKNLEAFCAEIRRALRNPVAPSSLHVVAGNL
ncbi:MAG: hypothetical protein COZ05_18775, partial [Armatimonadetes bacterium CG_4_10_14_3_um_filter_59_10]